MLIKESLDNYLKQLNFQYSQKEIKHYFYLLLAHYTSVTRLDVAMKPQLTLSEKDEFLLCKALEKLKTNMPIQYIIEETYFYGLPFKVTGDVLIPRPETEELVSWILDEISGNVSILDIGTGSGCIAISLAKHLPNAKVYALDVSKKALEMAKLNAKHNAVDITFIHADILDQNIIETYF